MQRSTFATWNKPLSRTAATRFAGNSGDRFPCWIEIPDGHRFGFHNLRHALNSFLVEIGTDPKTIQDMLRWADPSILLKVYAHSRMDKRMEAQAKMMEAMV